MEFSWTTWLVSVVAVIISGALAWLEGNLTKHRGLDMGFVNHGGMWGDLVLLPVANAVIVPHVQPGAWIVAALAVSSALSAWVHVHWYRGDRTVSRPRWSVPGSRSSVASPESSFPSPRSPLHSREHMWPARRHGSWWRDLSWAGWAHLLYVVGELTILIGFLLFPMPDEAIAVVCVIFTLHVPLGLLQPRWFLTGEIATPRKQPLLAPLLATLWVVALVKVM